METVIIESNRKSAYADQARAQRNQEAGQLNNVPSGAHPNYEWSTGLEVGVSLNPGDQIKVTASMIHARGDPANTIEMGGAAAAERPDDLVDNEAALKVGYYITNRHQFNFPMPQMFTQIRGLWTSPLYGEVCLDTYQYFMRAYPYSFIEGHHVNPDNIPGPFKRTQQNPYFSYDTSQPLPWQPEALVTNEISLNPPWHAGDIAGQESMGGTNYIEAPDVEIENWWVPISNGPHEICRPSTARLAYMGAYYTGPANLLQIDSTTVADTVTGQLPFSQQISLSVPAGFTSPSAVADTLTAQFHNRDGQASAWDDSTITPKTFGFEPEGGRVNTSDTAAFTHQPNIEVPLFPATICPDFDRIAVVGGDDTIQQAAETAHVVQDFLGHTSTPPASAIVASNLTAFRGRPLPAVTDSSMRCIPTSTGQICYGREKVLDDLNKVPNDYRGVKWSCDIRGEYDPLAGTLPMNWTYVQQVQPGVDPVGAPNQCRVCQHPEGYKQSEGYGMYWAHMLCGNTKDAKVADMWGALGRTAVPASSVKLIMEYDAVAAKNDDPDGLVSDNQCYVLGGWIDRQFAAPWGVPKTPRHDGTYASAPDYLNSQWTQAPGSHVAGLTPVSVSQYGFSVVLQDKLAYRNAPESLSPFYASSVTTGVLPDTYQYNTTAKGEVDHYTQKIDDFVALNISPGAWMATNIPCTRANLQYIKMMLKAGEYPASKNTTIPARTTTAPWDPLAPPQDAAFQFNDITTPVYQAPTQAQKQAMDANMRFRMQFGRSDDQYCCGAVGKHIALPNPSNVSQDGLAGSVVASSTWNLVGSYFSDADPATLELSANYKATNPTNNGYLSNTGFCQRLYYEADNEVRKGKDCIPACEIASRYSPLMDPRRPGNMFCRPSNDPNLPGQPVYSVAHNPDGWQIEIPQNQMSNFFQLQLPPPQPHGGLPPDHSVAGGYDDELLNLIAELGLSCVPCYMTEQAIEWYDTAPVGLGAGVYDLRRVPFIAFVNMTDFYDQLNVTKDRSVGMCPCPGIGEYFGPSPSLNDQQFAKVVSTQKTDPSKAPPDRTLVIDTGTDGSETPNSANGNNGPWEMSPHALGGSQQGLNTFSYPQCHDMNIWGVYDQGTTTPGSRTGDYYFAPDTMCGATHRYASFIYIGADQPECTFEGEAYGRFSLKYLHSACRTGNGPWQWIAETENDQALTESAFVNSKQSMISCTAERYAYGKYAVAGSTNPPGGWHYHAGEKWQRISTESWYDITQRSPPPQVITSQSGISILSLSSPTKEQAIARTPVEEGWVVTDSWHPNLFEGTLFHRMGFNCEQLLPLYGQPNSSFNRSTAASQLGFDGPSAIEKYNTMVQPLTTNGYVFSDLDIGIAQNVLEYPMQNLGIARTSQAITNVESDLLLAKDLPFKLSYPYLVVYSDIVPKVSYYGGPRGMTQSLPALAFIGRSYDSSDYVYAFATDWAKTITKSFVLNHFSVSIRTPNGLPAQLDENSSIIFEIQRRLQLPPPLPPAGETAGEKSHATSKHASEDEKK